MTSLIAVRDNVALAGMADAHQLSLQLKAPQPLVQAMLDKLVAMRKLEAVEPDNSCLSGSCKSCADGKKCLTVSYRLIPS
ncbi:MAG: FeoC-like transcriptional regulator [Ewingella americana]|jgi:ferrous iron transport protein C|uniref:FeoC-like transcriptional regulator n=1 Tax=Ewingella americana TaxID=41202 RepID=UPI002432BA6D|nr:FeoC-like transcriptional regulator [Ewingella americana]MCI1679741.1 FeoC-like transcriptional regulator [Ewingella americana]MCI1855425.1 FeoC-like transcriptional regulator [Ewingella americana]MCI1863081.1 FeoC-like transcriptional regulator [Ewingella americana]MCI2140755.1 FeoC-like transcriptional regulator [Ewingella americana]MCI2164774.1 FeoC-like transcriptional regulator [Ewingella americana]